MIKKYISGCGKFQIYKGNHGIRSGKMWGIWKNNNFIYPFNALTNAKIFAELQGAGGKWKTLKR